MKEQDERELVVQATVEHAEKLMTDHAKGYWAAIEGSDKKRTQVVLTFTIDASGQTPVVTGGLSFKDKDKENGMDVNKTYHSPVLRLELPDPNQAELPGTPAPEPVPVKPKRGRK